MNNPAISLTKGIQIYITSPLLTFSIIENLMPAPAPAESSRPVRTNRNGRMAQLQETSDLLGQGLAKKMAGTGGKRTRNQLDNAPENLPENEMAPPVRAKRQRLNKVLPIPLDVPFTHRYLDCCKLNDIHQCCTTRSFLPDPWTTRRTTRNGTHAKSEYVHSGFSAKFFDWSS